MIWQAEPREVGRHLAGIDWRYAGAAVMLVLADRTLMALRWIALLAPLAPGTRPSTATLMRIFFVSTFVGSFLPMSVGSDAVRAWGLSREGITTHESLASVLMDRLLGVVSLLIMAAAGLMVVPALAGNPWVLLAMAATLAACALGLAAVFSEGAASAGRRWLERLPEGRARRGAVRLIDALQAYRRHRGVAAGVLAASVGVQVLRILQAWLLGLSLGITAGAAAYFAFVPLIHEMTAHVDGRPRRSRAYTIGSPDAPSDRPGIVNAGEQWRAAVNVDAAESDSAAFLDAEARSRIAVDERVEQKAAIAKREREAEHPLWRYAIALMLGLLLIEGVIGTSARAGESEAPGPSGRKYVGT